MSRRLAALALFATACARDAAPRSVPTARNEDDPAPVRAEASESAPTDEGPQGLSLANEAVRARATVAALLDALGRGDANAALALMDDPVARTLPRIGPRAQPAALVVRGLTVGSQPSSPGASPRIGRVRPILEVLGDQPLPDGIAASDLVVEVDLRETGIAPRIPSQSGTSSFIVRPGPPPRVIGL